MRRRLAAIYVLLLAMVLAGLEVPLAITLASQQTQQMALDRLSYAVRFASLAEPAFRHPGDQRALQNELTAYHEVYGIATAVVSRDGRTLVSAGNLPSLADDEVESALERALAGEQVGPGRVIWPWRTEPLVVTVPVGTGRDHVGAVITASPTNQVRSAVRDGWLMLAALWLAAVLVSMAAAEALARWTLKPVAQLDAVAHMITEGDYEARVPAYVGPPELRRLAGAFNEMADNVSDALERQRVFVSQASHQMRNPLTALQLRVESLGEDMATPEGKAEHQLAMEETARLSRILDSLLALARAERGRFQIENVDAAKVAVERVMAWQPLARQRQIDLRYAASETPMWVAAITTALDQCLDALIDNSLKFGRAGTRVDVSVHVERDGVVVHVLDTGPGMTEEQRRRATERFWRAPGAQNVEGSGLGLPIVAVLVETSGGRFDLLPVEPHGVDARLWLPGTIPATRESRWHIPSSIAPGVVPSGTAPGADGFRP